MLIYSQATFQVLRDEFGISIENAPFLPVLPALPLPGWLVSYLAVNQLSPASAKSEKAISEMLIAPVLSAVKEMHPDKIALFSGEPMAIGELTGICDFILAANPRAYLPEPPIVVLVEAKKQDLFGGIPQCVAEMIAARQINQQAGQPAEMMFGCVTTGTEWLFLQLTGQTARTDPTILYYPDLNRVLGAFQWMIGQFVGL